MGQIIYNAKVRKRKLSLSNIPFSDNTKVQVIILPMVNYDDMKFNEAQKITKTIPGNLSDDLIEERNKR